MDPSNPANPYPAEIEAALNAVLAALIEHKPRRSSPIPVVFASDLLGKPIPTRRQSEVRALARDPVGASLRKAVRMLGEDIFEAGGHSLMLDVAERAAEAAPEQVGRRASVIDHAWRGIGDDRGRWLS